MKPKIALIRGKFLTKYDMETFEKLNNKYDFTAFSSMRPIQENFLFPVVKLESPMDFPDFPYKLPILNRIFVDAHFLVRLEEKLRGYDIAHTAETYFNFTQQAINAKMKGYVKKIVCTNFENIPFNNEGILGRKKFKKKAYEHVDHFIGVTKGAKEALVREGVSERKISIISMGINTRVFKPAVKKKEASSINILFAGRIEEYKGIFDLLSAFNLLLKQNTDRRKLRLTIVGKGSKEKDLEQKINEYGISAYVIRRQVGYEKMPAVYGQADIFVGPSKKDRYWTEQFGMVFLEAMACGLPIISTKSGAIPEVIGSAGILVGEGDAFAMVNALNLLISNRDKRLNIGAKARKRAVGLFDTSVTSKKMDKVYQKLLS